MSKQTEAKAAQGYTNRGPTYANCVHFSCSKEEVRYNHYSTRTWTRESNLRCGIGGFKCGKVSWCARYEANA